MLRPFWVEQYQPELISRDLSTDSFGNELKTWECWYQVKQFDFNESEIFGKFDLFCKRVQKLIDMFTTIQ